MLRVFYVKGPRTMYTQATKCPSMSIKEYMDMLWLKQGPLVQNQPMSYEPGSNLL